MNKSITKNRRTKPVSFSHKMLHKIDRLIHNWEDAKNTDTYIFLSSPRKAIWANIMIGVSRGVGFVIGVSIIGVIVTTVLGALLSKFVTIPIIGQFIAVIVKSVQEYLGKNAMP